MKLPKTMQAVTMTGYGSPDVLRVEDYPVPDPGEGEVLLHVYASGINRPDILQRKGYYPPPPGASAILGLEVSGEVVKLGAGVSEWKLGDQVCALLTGGGYADYVNVPATLCLPVPHGLTMLEAAALPEAFFTVWSNVFQNAQLKRGEIFLVHAGASGIGTTAIQLANSLGAVVYATAGSQAKCLVCEQLGAKRALNYKSDDFASQILVLTQNKGVDVILDVLGGEMLTENIKLAALGGRIAVIAFLTGWRATVDLRLLLSKRLTLTGSTLRTRSVDEKAQIADALLKQVWPLLELGKIKPYIHKVFSLQQVVESHQLMESNGNTGKLVLQLREW